MLKKLEKSLQLIETSKQNKLEYSHHDLNYHKVISRSYYNPRVSILLEPIFIVLAKFHPPIFFDPKKIDITLANDTRIFYAIVNQQSEKAFKIMKKHLKITEKHNYQLYKQKKYKITKFFPLPIIILTEETLIIPLPFSI